MEDRRLIGCLLGWFVDRTVRRSVIFKDHLPYHVKNNSKTSASFQRHPFWVSFQGKLFPFVVGTEIKRFSTLQRFQGEAANHNLMVPGIKEVGTGS